MSTVPVPEIALKESTLKLESKAGAQKSAGKATGKRKASDPELEAEIAALEGKTVTEVLISDHRKVDKLFKECLDLPKGDKKKVELVKKIVEELSIHANIEEKVYYPAVYKAWPGMVLESLEEHHFVKIGLKEVQVMSVNHPRYDAKVHVIKEMIEHHVKEEEEKLFPEVDSKISKEEQIRIGKEVLEAKRTVSREPKPEESMAHEDDVAEEEEKQDEAGVEHPKSDEEEEDESPKKKSKSSKKAAKKAPAKKKAAPKKAAKKSSKKSKKEANDEDDD